MISSKCSFGALDKLFKSIINNSCITIPMALLFRNSQLYKMYFPTTQKPSHPHMVSQIHIWNYIIIFVNIQCKCACVPVHAFTPQHILLPPANRGRRKLIPWPCGCCVRWDFFKVSDPGLVVICRMHHSLSYLLSQTTTLNQPSATLENFMFLFFLPPGQPQRHHPTASFKVKDRQNQHLSVSLME